MSRDIKDLDPRLQTVYRQWLIQCHAAGLAVNVICTSRDDIEQEAAFETGKSKARPGQSPHNCKDTAGKPASKAFDFGAFDEHARYITDGHDHRYRQAGEIGEKLGLVWGGKFKSIFDPGHLELANWKNI